jgi:hypothetical protein
MGGTVPPFARAALALCLGSSLSGVALAAPAWPLKINAAGRYLETQNGTPFLIAADTAWCMVNGLNDAQIDVYLAARKAQGFNAIQFMLMAKHSGCAVGGSSVDRYGNSPFMNGDGDWSVPNEAYWTRVDAILNKVKAHDMLAIVTPAYLGLSCYYTDQGWCGVMEDQSAQRMSDFGTFLGDRYKSQGNIVWIAGGDANPMDYPGMDAKVDALMSALAAADTGRQLITGHAGRHVSAFQGFGTHAWLTLNSAYDGESCPDDSMAGQIAAEYARTPVQPLLSIEQMYDQEGGTGPCLADQFLWIALGGGVGQSYGNGVVWKFASSWNSPGTGINSPIARVHTNAAKLVRSRRFWLFRPDYAHRMVIAGYGSGASTVSTARAVTGETVMAYVPIAGTLITVNMGRISGATKIAYWYDPSIDTATLIGMYATYGNQTFESPGTARVLVIDDASMGYPPPALSEAVFPEMPLPVAGVSVSKMFGLARISWNSQDPPGGVATSYDVVSGGLVKLRVHGNYALAGCLVDNVATPSYDDPRLDPVVGGAYYYYVRASGPNGPGTYGPAALDAASPCP